MSLSPEILVPRIGEVLVNEGMITEDQLKFALEEQNRLSANDQWMRVGEILVGLGYIDRENLNQAITRQILKFQQALLDANKTLEARVAARTAELEAANRKLSELDILKTNFISNISHELRTPLTHIRGYLDLVLLEDCIQENSEVLVKLDAVQRSTERLENLINDLITFSMAETGQLTLVTENFNIVEVAKLSISRFKLSAAGKAITIQLESPQEEIYITADKYKIAWVINQLINNAIKYMQQPGKINLRISTKNDHALIEVEDSGPGFKHSKVEEAFLPFHQLDGNTNRQQGGTGIGLTLAKIIIEAHNSEIHVESKTDIGSRIGFELPLST
ncbi:MAG: HAMP domain-containing sensor histidine kinase [Anaerolineaceae bacterium]|jgi:signal transduction histidine kinase